MSSIPLAVNPPVAPIDPIQQAGQALTLQNLIQGIREKQAMLPGQLQAQQQQLQAQQQAVQSGAVDLQLKQQQLKDQAAIGNILWGSSSAPSTNGAAGAAQATPGAAAPATDGSPLQSQQKVSIPEPDPDKFSSKLQLIQQSPDISPKGKLDFTNQLTEMQQKRATLDATTLANEDKVMGRVGNALTSVANAAPEDQPSQYTLERNALLRDPSTAQMAQQIPAQYAGPDQLKADIQRYTTIRDMTEWTKQQNEGPGQQAESQQKVQAAKAPTPEQIQNATKTLSSYAAIPAPERFGLQREMQNAPDWETLQKVQARADSSQQANQLHQDTLANTRAIMGNKFGEAGLTANEKIWTDPQRGFAGALAQANQTKASIVAGADGNGLLTNLVPTMEVLGVNHAAGINRISPQEAIAAGTNPEWATRWNAWATKAATGKLTKEMADQGQQLMDIVTDGAYNRSIQSSQLIAKGHQLSPDQVPAMNRDGSLTTLDKVSSGASSGPKPSAGPAAGMTRIKASDGAIYDIPSQNLFKARRRDPQLQVVQ